MYTIQNPPIQPATIPSPLPLDPFVIDARLVAAVQTHAGGRCHEAANLLTCYTIEAELHRRAVSERDPAGVREARQRLNEVEPDLRRLLRECRRRDYSAMIAALAAAAPEDLAEALPLNAPNGIPGRVSGRRPVAAARHASALVTGGATTPATLQRRLPSASTSRARRRAG